MTNEKKAYRTPTLQSFGALKALTASGSIMMTEMNPQMPMMARP